MLYVVKVMVLRVFKKLRSKARIFSKFFSSICEIINIGYFPEINLILKDLACKCMYVQGESILKV